jgi:hypothetical protein
MVQQLTLTDLDVDFFLQHPEVQMRLNNDLNKQISFNLTIPQSIQNYLSDKLGITVSNQLPMRIIRGDTHLHEDISVIETNFDNTFLIYLTDSEGFFVLGKDTYPIQKKSAYIFPHNEPHGTIHTGEQPRLMIGPMSENSITVGAPNYIILYPDNENTCYIRLNEGTLEYSLNSTDWYTLYANYPIYINNGNDLSGNVFVEFLTDISIIDVNFYIICNSNNIVIGSNSLRMDGTTPVIDVQVENYRGFIQNGNEFYPGYNNISVYNLTVNSSGSGSLAEYGGWIGCSYFASNAENNAIINCKTSSSITANSGGIVGAFTGFSLNPTELTSLVLTGCSSYGSINAFAGGIVGPNSGFNTQVVCTQCSSFGTISSNAGGIFGASSNNIVLDKCFSSGSLIGTNGGGLVGSLLNCNIYIYNCYSLGVLSDTSNGGFCGFMDSDSDEAVNTVIIDNCYSLNALSFLSQTPSSDTRNVSISNSYLPGGALNWSSIDANANLTGTPTIGNIGNKWVEIEVNTPYEIRDFGYSVYTLQNINSNDNSLVQDVEFTKLPGETINGLIEGNYTLLSSDSNYFLINSITGNISIYNETPPGTYHLYIRFNNDTLSNTSVTILISVIENITDETSLLSFLNSNDNVGLIVVSQIPLTSTSPLIANGEKLLATNVETNISITLA